MKKIQLVLLACAMLLLGACADKEMNEEETTEEEKIGFSVTGGSIEEAANVPADEKEAILEAFDVYMTAFNEKNIDAYMATLGSEYDAAEERAFLEKHFEDFDQIRRPTNITIVDYKKDEAQLFANIDNELRQLSTGFETSDRIRQVTVLTKENGDWKIKSIHSIGENPSAE